LIFMSGEVLNPLLAFGAGALTILSPCVLPLVPVVLGSAAQRHRLGALALAGGLIASFTIVGFVLAAFGSRLGIDPDQVRVIGAIILGAAGAFLLLPKLQDRVAYAAAPLMGWAGERQQRLDNGGLWAQAAIGILLGLVWSPCVGPTLGAAIALAAQGRDLSRVALTMAAFATGIAAVLVSIAFIGRTLFASVRNGLASKAKVAKVGLGGILVAVSILVLTGLDRVIEAEFVLGAPDWLVQLTTAI
jgi:cytochrome c-type biogenesis protein